MGTIEEDDAFYSALNLLRALMKHTTLLPILLWPQYQVSG